MDGRPAAARPKTVGHPLGAIAVAAIAGGDGRAEPRELVADGGADPARAAGHECEAAGQDRVGGEVRRVVGSGRVHRQSAPVIVIGFRSCDAMPCGGRL
jgi:hypothetical protein